MRKQLLVILCVLLTILAGCSSEIKATNSSSNIISEKHSENKHNVDQLLPLYFDDETSLKETIRTIKKMKGEAEETPLVIDSQIDHNQEYDTHNDIMKLASMEKLYAPQEELMDTCLSYIAVKREYVMYHYNQAQHDEGVNFTWFREMSPEVAMNELENRGAKYREINRDAIKYVILEWPNIQTGEIAGYTIHWVEDGKAFQASIPIGYSDEEMLIFCSARKVSISE